MLLRPIARLVLAPCLLLGALSSGCASSKVPRKLNGEAAAWAYGTSLQIEGPLEVDPGNTPFDRNAMRKELRTHVEERAREAGFSLVPAGSPGSLTLRLLSFARARATGAFLRGEEKLADLDADADNLSCYTPLWGWAATQNFKCYARAVVDGVLASERGAQAARQLKSPPPPAAPAAAQASVQPPAPRQHLALKGKLAVLELRNYAKGLTRENAQYFTDVVRQATLRLEPQLEVMTRENLLVLLESSGKKLEECEGECEVDTGRRIGADHIISGEIQKLGSRYKLTLRLHDTHEGRLLASAIGSGTSLEQLDDSASKAAEELFAAR